MAACDLGLWLKLNGIISDKDTNNEILQKSLPEVVKLFGLKELFLCLADGIRSDRSKCESMHQIISKQIMIIQNDTDVKQLMNYSDKVTTTVKIKSKKAEPRAPMNINNISNESVEHITDYLDKTDVQSFKNTSRRNSIISLQQMAKYGVTVIDPNKLCSDMNFVSLSPLTTISRYPITKTYGSLMDEWCEKYGIAPDDLITFQLLRGEYLSNIGFYPVSLLHLRFSRIEKKQTFLLLDKRKLTVRTPQMKVRKFNAGKDWSLINANKDMPFDSIKKQKLIILRYFDIGKQMMKTVGFIFVQDGTNPRTMDGDELRRYITHNFIPMDGIDDEWRVEFHKIMMGIQKQPNFVAYIEVVKLEKWSGKIWTFDSSLQRGRKPASSLVGSPHILVFHPQMEWVKNNDFLISELKKMKHSRAACESIQNNYDKYQEVIKSGERAQFLDAIGPTTGKKIDGILERKRNILKQARYDTFQLRVNGDEQRTLCVDAEQFIAKNCKFSKDRHQL